MGKSRNYDKEVQLIDRLKKENAELKRDLAKIRRQLDRLNIDHDRYRTLRELVHKQVQEDRHAKKTKDKWNCWQCGKGTLTLHIFPRRDGDFYYRSCNMEGCGHRTPLKKYTPDVEGVMEEKDED
jgi:arginyl-tRNA synthetase